MTVHNARRSDVYTKLTNLQSYLLIPSELNLLLDIFIDKITVLHL